jgi:cytochrome c oxidase subunit II
MTSFLRALAVATALFTLAIAITYRPAHAHPSIDVVASNWKFTPNSITLHMGETSTLRFTSSGGVHGVKSEELGIPMTTITPGNFVTVEVTPKKAGTYVLPCQIMCGAGHADMKLTVVVQ